MRIIALDLPGSFILEPTWHPDARGRFGRGFSAAELSAQGLNPSVSQINLGFSYHRGTIRGLHWQCLPHAETKIVRCTRGAVWDVIVDLRPASVSWGRWAAVELTPENGRAIYIPEGFAHGYQVLSDESEILYSTSQAYEASAARGARWDDPVLSIEWPLPPTMISDADRSWPSLEGPSPVPAPQRMVRRRSNPTSSLT